MKKLFFAALVLLSLTATAQVPGTNPIFNTTTDVPQATAPSNPRQHQRYLSTNGNYYRYVGSSWIIDNPITGQQAADIAANNAKVSYPGPQNAAGVSFSPYLTLGSTTVQNAFQELKDELDAAVIGGGGSVDLSAVSQNIVPDGNNTRNLGSASNYWQNLFVSNIALNGGLLTNGRFGLGAFGTAPVSADGEFWFNSNDFELYFRRAGTFNRFLFAGDPGSTDDQTASEVSYDNTISGLPATNTKTAIDELASSINNGTSFEPVSHSTGELLTYDNTDVTVGGVSTAVSIINDHFAKDTIDVSGITDLKNYLKDKTYADSLLFVRPNDVYFYTRKGVEKTNDFLKIGRNQYAITRKLSDSSGIKRFEINVENYIMVDSLGYVNPNPEEYTNSNALALLNNTNSTTGLDAFSGVTQTSIANTSPASTTHSWEITSTVVDNNSRGREVLVLSDAAEIYEYEFWARSVNGDESTTAYRFVSGTTDASYFSGVITNTWTKISGTFEATSVNPVIQFHTNYLAGGSIGDKIEVTGLSIKIQ